MRLLKLTIYRTLEWETEIELPDEVNEKRDEQAIASLAASQQSRDFDSVIEEYAETADGRRIDII